MTNKPEVVAYILDDGVLVRDVRASQLVDGSYDPACPLIRQSDHIAEVSKMVEALKAARDALAFALRAAAPDFFESDDDIVKHSTISLIDRALGGGG